MTCKELVVLMQKVSWSGHLFACNHLDFVRCFPQGQFRPVRSWCSFSTQGRNSAERIGRIKADLVFEGLRMAEDMS